MPPVPPKPAVPDLRIAALRRFAAAITILNVLGRLYLGIEPSWVHMFVAMATAYSLETIFELIDSRVHRRQPLFLGHGVVGVIDFLLPGHISALACSMLLYSGDELLPAVFATAVAVGSKAMFRAPVGNGEKHFLNPSNTGITITLLFFPRVGGAPPYQFSEWIANGTDMFLPLVFITAGTFLNGKFTKKLPLIAGWLLGFAAQGIIRHFIFGTWVWASLSVMTGLAFLLFTFYMVSDPATTPFIPKRQFIFGVSVAAVYGVGMALHIAYSLFYALFIVCIVRGIGLHVMARRKAQASRPVAVHGAGAVGPVAVVEPLVPTFARAVGAGNPEPQITRPSLEP